METVWTITDYLRALKQGQVITRRPFDSQTGCAYELGEHAKALVLPELNLERIIPPKIDFIRQLYLLLQPVLLEITENSEFQWYETYGEITARELAKSYLIYAITTATPQHIHPLSRQHFAYQDFLRQVSEALVDEIAPEHAPDYFRQRPHIQKEFDTMLLTLNVDCPTLPALIVFYKNREMYSMAYKASLFLEEEFERGISEQLKPVIQNLANLVRAKPSRIFKSSKIILPESEEIDAVEDLPQALRLIERVLQKALDINSKKLNLEIIQYIKSNCSFMTNRVNYQENHSKQELQKQLKELLLVLESTRNSISIQKINHAKLWINTTSPNYINFT